MSSEEPARTKSRRAPGRRFAEWFAGFPMTLILGGVYVVAFSDQLAGPLIAGLVLVIPVLAAAQWWVERHHGDAPEVELVSIAFYLLALIVAFAFASSTIDDLSAALLAITLIGLPLRSISKVLGARQQQTADE